MQGKRVELSRFVGSGSYPETYPCKLFCYLDIFSANARTSDRRQHVHFSDSLIGCGAAPSFTNCSQCDLEMGRIGGTGGTALLSPMISLTLTYLMLETSCIYGLLRRRPTKKACRPTLENPVLISHA
jgi:hypothetical protein